MPYTHFRYIAYEVPTATSKFLDLPRSGFPAGLPCAAVARCPISSDTPLDAQIRLKRLAAVVDRAVTFVQEQMPADGTTLNVFMAPEFYFRPPNLGPQNFQNETYPYRHVIAIVEQLDQMFLHADFEHWLVVAGTVMWNDKEGDKPVLYQNSVMTVSGHVKKSLRVVEKEVASSMDGVPNPYAVSREAYDPFLEKAFQRWKHRERHVFDVGGVQCGVEVCLDHYGGREDRVRTHRVLKTVLSDWQKQNKERAPDVKLHLLTAGGMAIHHNSVAAVPGGYILRNDGFSGSPHSELRKIIDYEKPRWVLPGNERTDPWDLDGTAKLYEPISQFVEVPLCGNELVPMFGGNYREFPQRLVFYPRLPLP